jgi:hypothetical protein
MNTINTGHDFVLLSIGSQIMKSQKEKGMRPGFACNFLLLVCKTSSIPTH